MEMLFDAHNHIQGEALAAGLPGIMERAIQAGVGRMMTCATGAKGDWDRLLRLDDRYRGTVAISIGLHPWYVAATVIDWKSAMQKILDERPFSIGEIGLDRSDKVDCPIEDQLKAFGWQADLAVERHLPVTIHCVNAWDYLENVLLTRPKLRFLMHSYFASPELTAILARRDTFFSIGPTSFGTHRKPLEPMLAKIPSDRLLIETDSPDARFPKDMNPAAANEPARLKEICERLAKLMGKDVAEVEKQTFDNAERFFAPAHATAKPVAAKPV
jgi:TatD DNase family protein